MTAPGPAGAHRPGKSAQAVDVEALAPMLVRLALLANSPRDAMELRYAVEEIVGELTPDELLTLVFDQAWLHRMATQFLHPSLRTRVLTAFEEGIR